MLGSNVYSTYTPTGKKESIMFLMAYKITVVVQGAPDYYYSTGSWKVANNEGVELAKLGEIVKVKNNETGENHYYPDKATFMSAVGVNLPLYREG